MGLWVKIWTDLLHDEWFMGLRLPEKGAYFMLIVLAKEQGDTGHIYCHGWKHLSQIFGCFWKSCETYCSLFVTSGKLCYEKNHAGILHLELLNYEKWQGLNPKEQRQKSRRGSDKKLSLYDAPNRVEKSREEQRREDTTVGRSADADCSKELFKMQRAEEAPTHLVYFKNFPFSRNLPERDQYKLIGKLIKKCLNRPKAVTQFLHRRCDSLSKIQTQEGFYRYINKPCGDAEFMGECESAAYKQDDGTQRGGMKSIKETLEE
jgi:hypothetical protein